MTGQQLVVKPPTKEEDMKLDPSKSLGFSRVLGLSDAVALGFCISVALIYSVVGPVVRFSEGEAPILWLVGAVIFLPIILSYAREHRTRPGTATLMSWPGPPALFPWCLPRVGSSSVVTSVWAAFSRLSLCRG